LLDDTFNLVLADFGSATTSPKSSKKIGTTLYMSPELYKGIEYDCLLNDIYSSAIIAFALITGMYPQDSRSPFFFLIGDGDFSNFWNTTKVTVSDDFKDLFERILVPQSL
jgi:serine/threonine protein kinase